MRERLYALDKNGRIRVFYGEVSLIGPASPNTASYRTYTGVLEGKHIPKITYVNKGKQKRNSNQQAEFELNSAYNEKYDEGYKSEEMLAKRLSSIARNEYVIGLEEPSRITRYFSVLNIQYNTNKDWNPLPMLAERYDKHKKKIVFPIFAQPKLNGVRCIAIKIGSSVALCSRGGGYYKIPHIQSALLPLFNAYNESGNILLLDGEIYKHGVPLQFISGAARDEANDLFNERQHFLEYHVYDANSLNDNWKFKSRLDCLEWIASVKDAFNPLKISPLKIVKTELVASHEAIKIYHDECIAKGYEGIILRNPEEDYKYSFRDLALIKVKEYEDGEFTIVGSETDHQGNPESFVFIVRNDINDLTFKAKPTGTNVQKTVWMSTINNYIGKKATVRYQERSTDGLPMQGHVRHKDSVCLLEHIRPDGE